MKSINKLFAIGFAVLMFSFMNIANVQPQDCSVKAVNFCNQSKTPSDCANTFRPAAPTMQCAWDYTSSTCRANGSACYAPTCKSTSDCIRGYSCVSDGNGPTACQRVSDSGY